MDKFISSLTELFTAIVSWVTEIFDKTGTVWFWLSAALMVFSVQLILMPLRGPGISRVGGFSDVVRRVKRKESE